ncbi:MAG: iron-containing alcohol dehydrogenase [Candidatus Riflebacteria bacterium]|nr:iron-containing alcohol dehydrogenase [Candidatus Riflebacteria bacterium]
MLEGFQFHSPTRILYGCGVLSELGGELSRFGKRRALLVTERALCDLGFHDRVEKALRGSTAELVLTFDQVVPNAELAVVRKGAEAARARSVDLVIAIGGGSAIDTAKAINLVLTHGGDLMDHQGAQCLTGPCGPLVAVPTTAGTGSEVTNVAVIRDGANQTKVAFVDSYLAPDLAVLDPELTLTLPPRMTAATAMDALTHAVEAYVSASAFPIADALAISAMEMIGSQIIDAVRYPDNLNMAGMAFNQAGVGCVHAMSHSLGGVFGVGHGEANAVLLPYGMEYNLTECPERFADLARAVGARETRNMSLLDVGTKGIERVRQLQLLLREHGGMPTRLSDLGVTDDRLFEVAAASVTDGAMIYNRRVPDEESILQMLRQAL